MKKLYLGVVLALIMQCSGHSGATNQSSFNQEWFKPLKTINNFLSLVLVTNYLRALHHWHTILDEINNAKLTRREKESRKKLAERVSGYVTMFKEDLEKDGQATRIKEYFEILEKRVESGCAKRALEREFLKNLENVREFIEEKRIRWFLLDTPNHLRKFARECKGDPRKFNFGRNLID